MNAGNLAIGANSYRHISMKKRDSRATVFCHNLISHVGLQEEWIPVERGDYVFLSEAQNEVVIDGWYIWQGERTEEFVYARLDNSPEILVLSRR